MGQRGRACPICVADPLIRGQLEALHGSGNSYVKIASLMGEFNKFQISRHFRHVDKPVTVDDNSLSALERSERRLAELSERAEQSWLAAATSGDSKNALDILKSQLRLELDRHKRLVEQSEQALVEAAKASDKDSPEYLDNLVRRYEAHKTEREKTVMKARASGHVDCPVCGSALIDPSVVAERMPAILAIANSERKIDADAVVTI
jgi:hypothetical protein